MTKEPVVSAAPTTSYRLLHAAMQPLFHSLIRVRVSGREHMPTAGAVIIANHTQWLDGPLLLGALPTRPRIHTMGDPASLRAVRIGPLRLGRVLYWCVRHLGGLIPVDRTRHGDVELRSRVSSALAEGASVALFPEATYIVKEFAPQLLLPGCEGFEKGGGLLPFRKGFAHFAQGADAPIVPVAINGARRIWLGKRIDVVIGEPIDSRGRTVAELTETAQQRLLDLMRPDRPRRGPKPFMKLMSLESTRVRGAARRQRAMGLA